MKTRSLYKFRIRFTLFVVLCIIIITCIANLLLGLSDVQGLTVVEYKTIEVQSGDTLWDIACDYMPSKMDTREAVYEICKLNDISASTLYAGMEIQIPIYH